MLLTAECAPISELLVDRLAACLAHMAFVFSEHLVTDRKLLRACSHGLPSHEFGSLCVEPRLVLSF